MVPLFSSSSSSLLVTILLTSWRAVDLCSMTSMPSVFMLVLFLLSSLVMSVGSHGLMPLLGPTRSHPLLVPRRVVLLRSSQRCSLPAVMLVLTAMMHVSLLRKIVAFKTVIGGLKASQLREMHLSWLHLHMLRFLCLPFLMTCSLGTSTLQMLIVVSSVLEMLKMKWKMTMEVPTTTSAEACVLGFR